MDLRFDAPPPQVAGLVTRTIRAYARGDFARAPDAYLAADSTAVQYHPYAMYCVDRSALRDGGFVGSARLAGWQVPHALGGRPWVVVEIARSEIVDGVMLASVTSGWMAAALLDALAAVEQLAEGASYVLRLLRVPALSFEAFWLHRPEADLIVPIQAWSGVLAAHRPYPSDHVETVLADASDAAFESNAPRGDADD